jgi:hypothetical protein
MGPHAPERRQPAERDDRHRERGSAVVEAAIALPLTLVLLFAALQAGVLMRSHATTANAARFAGRTASIAGADPMADQRILARIDREAAPRGSARIRSIVVWHAATAGERVPAGCDLDPGSSPSTTSRGVTGPGTDAIGACNVYLNPDLPGGALDMATGRAAHPASHYFGCQGADDPTASQRVDCRWPAKDRRTVQSPRGTVGTSVSPDLLGIRIVVQHRLPVGLPVPSVAISQTSITLLEPRAFGLA